MCSVFQHSTSHMVFHAALYGGCGLVRSRCSSQLCIVWLKDCQFSVRKDCVGVGRIDLVGNILCQPSPSTATVHLSVLFIVYIPTDDVRCEKDFSKCEKYTPSLHSAREKYFTAKLINSHPHAQRSINSWCSTSLQLGSVDEEDRANSRWCIQIQWQLTYF